MTETLSAHYDSAIPAVVISDLTINETAVVLEARHWSTGRRGPAVQPGELADVELSNYITAAMEIGARAIASAGGVQDTYNLEELIGDVGARTAAATEAATASAHQLVQEAAAALGKASEQATKAIVEAGADARKSFNSDIETARNALTGEMTRLFSGENPELLARLAPALDKFSVSLNQRVAEQTTEMITKATRLFDPADPTSPMAKHTSELDRQHTALTTTLERNHKALGDRVEALTTAMAISRAAATIAAGTTLKGETYAQAVHRIMADIAGGLGDEYVDTSTVAGALPRCKKGDGVLVIDGGVTSVVLEMTDSTRTGWNSYLDEAERNRGSLASLGLVRTPEQLKGKHISCITGRRILLAFDPATDDPELLRTVIQLLRLSALAASARQDSGEIQTAIEKVTEAIAMLTRIDSIKKSAEAIKKSATKIELESDSVATDLARLLTQAHTALRGITDPVGSITIAA